MVSSIVICNGVIRSGSTWSFNVCRLLASLRAKRRGEPFVSNYVFGNQLDDFLNTSAPVRQGSAVLKAHTVGPLALEWIRTARAKSVCTFRDPRDCVASEMEFEAVNFDTAIARVVACLKTLESSMDFGRTLFIRYEDMMHDRMSQIRLIAAYLNVRVDEKELESIDNETNLATSKKLCSQISTLGPDQVEKIDNVPARHRTTLLHDHHISKARPGRWREDLTDAQGRHLMQLFQKALLLLGYETQESIRSYLLTPPADALASITSPRQEPAGQAAAGATAGNKIGHIGSSHSLPPA